MINSGKEWDWMDDRIHKSIDESLVEDLKGWGFDTDTLEREGAFAPQSTKSPRANLTQDEWCEYSGMPSPKFYE